MIDPLLRRAVVESLTGLSRSGLYAMIQEGRFPAQVRVGRRAVRWRMEEVEAWMRNPSAWNQQDRTSNNGN